MTLSKYCRLGLGTVLISPLTLWPKVIAYWRVLHNVQVHKLYLPTDIITIMEERKNERDMRHVYWVIRNT